MDKLNHQKISVVNKPGDSVVKTSEEYRLWQRFLAGEVAAFETLMRDQYRVLFRYATRFSKDKEFIKDCIQDLFLYVWEHRSSLRADVAVKPYLMVSLRRHMHRNIPGTDAATEYVQVESVSPFDLDLSVEEQSIHRETTANRIRQIVLSYENH